MIVNIFTDKLKERTMKKLNVTKERFEKSRYFQRKYGKLEYVSESGNLYKTSKGKILKFNESSLDYKVISAKTNVEIKAKAFSKSWAISIVLMGGKAVSATIQLASFRYNSDPWVRWEPGKKLKYGGGGDYPDNSGLNHMYRDEEFKNWLEGLIQEIESQYA